MSSHASSSRHITCPVCNMNPTKYTCPGCSTPSCSVLCSKKHKSDTGCHGQRNKVAYVPMNQYGWGQMMNDYTYLEDLGRRTTEWKGRLQEHNSYKKGKSKRQLLQSHLSARGIEMELLPLGMSRRKLNQSSFDIRNQTVYMTVEVRRRTESSKTSTLTHRHRLEESISSIADAHPLSWCAIGDSSVDLSSTLGEALQGRSFVEYPVFDLWDERPRKLGPGAMKSLLGDYDSGEEEDKDDAMTGANVGLTLLGGYGSESDAEITEFGNQTEASDEADWGQSDDEAL